MAEDEKLYLIATKEVDFNNQDEAIWAKAMALSEGDEQKAKYKYITLRVDKLIESGVPTESDPEVEGEDIEIPEVLIEGTGDIQDISAIDEAPIKAIKSERIEPKTQEIIDAKIRKPVRTKVVKRHIEAQSYARQKDIPLDTLINKLLSKEIAGVKKENIWYVLLEEEVEVGENRGNKGKRFDNSRVAIPDDGSPLIQAADFARKRNVSVDEVIELIYSGVIPAKKIGATWHVFDSDLIVIPGKEKEVDVSINMGPDYVPVAEFAKIKGIQEEKAIQMIREGFYSGKIKNGTWYASIDEISKPNNVECKDDVGFTWWTVWAWLGLILGNLLAFGELMQANLEELAFIAVGLNSILMIMILRFNKYAFLIATIISLNPLLWIINGLYLKKRWSHPKVNN